MGKKALAWASEDLAIPGHFSGIFTEQDFKNNKGSEASIFALPAHLLDRPACETDRSFQQILPYTSLRKRTADGVFVYVYQRGSGGGESRLHDKWSIGLGGHVEEAPSGAKSLLDVLAESAQRELIEEVGYTVPLNVMHNLVSNSVFIADRSDDVGHVHLGLAHTVDVPADFDISSQEVNEITNAHWASYEEIVKMNEEGKFENWSSLLIGGGFV